MGLDHEKRTGGVIGAAIEVHQAFGLAIELETRAIGCERQLAVPILYRRGEVGRDWP
jgi:hypothetical protein